MYKVMLALTLFLALRARAAVATELYELGWSDRPNQKVSRTFSQVEANEILERIKKRIPIEEDRLQFFVARSGSIISDRNYRVIAPIDLFNRYRLDQINEDQDGRKYYEKFVFNCLAHATTYNNLLKILKSRIINPRSKLTRDCSTSSGPCNPNVVYTMLMPNWMIRPIQHSSQVSNEVVIELPLSLLNRTDWYLSDGWWYGEKKIGHTWSASQFVSVKSILTEKDDAFRSIFDAHPFSRSSLRELGTYNLYFTPLLNEVVFQEPISFEEVAHALPPNGTGHFKAYFADLRQIDAFTKDLLDQNLSDSWRLEKTDFREDGTPFVVLYHLDNKRFNHLDNPIDINEDPMPISPKKPRRESDADLLQPPPAIPFPAQEAEPETPQA
jgi:hypothetical protein